MLKQLNVAAAVLAALLAAGCQRAELPAAGNAGASKPGVAQPHTTDTHEGTAA